MTPSSVPLLQIQNLGRRIDSRWLWQGVSFDLNAEKTLGIVGTSGIGKSLLLRSLVYLDPIQVGDVLYCGKSITRWFAPALRRQLLYLPQTPGILEGTVEDNLMALFRLKAYREMPRAASAPRQYSRQRVLTDLQAFNREEAFLTQSAERLSGGERQILALVRALQLDPQVLLLDEPTSALDGENTQRFERLIEQWLNAQLGRAYIWISHSLDQIERMTQTQLDLVRYVP